MTVRNKFDSFKPLMFEHEYKFIEKYLNKNDTFLEYGSGNSTLYFSGLVKKVISIEHDLDWINMIQKTIDAYSIDNVELIHVAANSPDPIPCRYEQFKDYIEYSNTIKEPITKVLIDGRARKYCAKAIIDIIDFDTIVFIHDFNREDYQKVLKYYEPVEILTEGQGIAALKKRTHVIHDSSYY